MLEGLACSRGSFRDELELRDKVEVFAVVGNERDTESEGSGGYPGVTLAYRATELITGGSDLGPFRTNGVVRVGDCIAGQKHL